MCVRINTFIGCSGTNRCESVTPDQIRRRQAELSEERVDPLVFGVVFRGGTVLDARDDL